MNLTLSTAELISQPVMHSPEMIKAYLYFLDVTFIVSLPLHLLILTMAIFYTPLEMFCYKMTVSNTTFWSTLVLIWLCLIVRPLILFPYPVAISFGPHFLFRSFHDAQFQFQILILFTLNMLTAMIICFVSLCLYLIQSPVMELLKRKTAVSLAVCVHATSTLFGWFLLNRLYRGVEPGKELADVLLAQGVKSQNSTESTQTYQSLLATVRQSDGIVFGFVPYENPPYISLLTWTFFSGTVVVVLICLFLVMVNIFKHINKSRSWRFKRNVFLMLASRTMIPLIFGFIPTIALTYMIWKDVKELVVIGNVLFAVASSQAMINCIATIGVFRPYRRTFLRLTTCCMPEETRRRLYQSTTTYVGKGALTTVSHWSKHNTSVHFNARVTPFLPTQQRRNATFERERGEFE